MAVTVLCVGYGSNYPRDGGVNCSQYPTELNYYIVLETDEFTNLTVDKNNSTLIHGGVEYSGDVGGIFLSKQEIVEGRYDFRISSYSVNPNIVQEDGVTYSWSMQLKNSGIDLLWESPTYSYTVLAAAPPEKPVNPTPANDATEIDFSAFLLAWEDGGDADTYDVYIGSTGDLTLVSSAQANTGYLTTLEELETIFSASPINQKIYWRVDATNDDGTTTGDEWNFDPRPAKASNPSPEDEYTPMTLDWQLFSWDAVDNADTYNVYMGTEVGETPWSENMELIVDSSPLSYIVQSYLATATKFVYPYTGLAVYNYQYYWRVDTKNIFGETTGDNWSLTTITFDPPVSSYRGDFSGVEGIDWNWDGKNNMVIVKRLVAAAKDALYYEVI